MCTNRWIACLRKHSLFLLHDDNKQTLANTMDMTMNSRFGGAILIATMISASLDVGVKPAGTFASFWAHFWAISSLFCRRSSLHRFVLSSARWRMNSPNPDFSSLQAPS
jgi:hypothetical protein